MPRGGRAEDVLKNQLRRILFWSGERKTRRRRYWLTFGLPNAVVWSAVGIYLAFTPETYTSQITLNLPGAGANSSVMLDNIGQTSTSAPSPFASNSMSPKVIYKSIAESDRVRGLAAKQLDMPFADVAKLRVDLIDETALLIFKSEGHTPEEAQKVATAYYNALEQQLDLLRKDEVERRAGAIRTTLSDVEANLKDARKRLVEFQQSSSIVSAEQFKAQTMALETLRMKVAELSAEFERSEAKRTKLAGILGIDPDVAAHALRVEADPRFQALLKEQAEALAVYSENSKKWGPKHPKVVEARNRADAARASMLKMAKSDIGEGAAKSFDTLMLVDSPGRAELFKSLIEADAESAGLAKQLTTLEAQMAVLKITVDEQNVAAAKLEDLDRDHKIAEAVFSSALARVDTNRQDIYASYPLVQVMADATLPSAPTSPRPMLAIAGGIGATFLILLAMVLAWIRQPIIRRLLKRK